SPSPPAAAAQLSRAHRWPSASPRATRTSSRPAWCPRASSAGATCSPGCARATCACSSSGRACSRAPTRRPTGPSRPTPACAGADLRVWSAWNEPNHPAFLNPQRGACGADAPALAPDRYARLVRALRAELEAAPGDQRVVLGETAALRASTATTTGAADFARALPRDVVCSAGVWARSEEHTSELQSRSDLVCRL